MTSNSGTGTPKQLTLWHSVTAVTAEAIERGRRALHDEFMENWDRSAGQQVVRERARTAQARRRSGRGRTR